MAGRLRERNTSDLLVLLIAGTICFSVAAGVLTVLLLSLFQPDNENAAAVALLSDVINTLIGLLAGFIAGRTDATQQIARDAAERAEKSDEPV
jgi:SNF family Na+-dependent transporter